MYRDFTFVQTPSPETVIWRYMDFSKFVSLINNSALFFSNVAALRNMDPYEATLSAHSRVAEKQEQLESMRKILEEDPVEPKQAAWLEEWVQSVADNTWDMQKQGLMSYNEMMTVNCWHMNGGESAAMWKLYGDGIAIQTTVGRLIESLNGATFSSGFGHPVSLEFYVGAVQYRNYETDPVDRHAFGPILTKRLSFHHENEVRVIAIIDPMRFGGLPDGSFPDGMDTPEIFKQYNSARGIYFKVDVDKLIDRIYVSPIAQNWVTDLIKSVSKKYDLTAPVIQSALYSAPIY